MTAGARVAGAGRLVAMRVRRHGPTLLLAATAAGISYLLASLAFGAREAFFAPIAAVVCVGLTAGQRIRRALEIVAGVAVGLVAADVVARVVPAAALALALAVLLATVLAVALGAGTLMSNQAAVAAVLVVALAPGEGNPLTRLGDALIGGAVALGLNAAFARDPLRQARLATGAVLDRVRAATDAVVEALTGHDVARAEAALAATDDAARALRELDDAVAGAREGLRLARRGRRARERIGQLVVLRGRLDLLLATTRGLARGAANAVRHGRAVPPVLVDAVRALSGTLADLDRWAAGEADAAEVRERALSMAVTASALLRGPHTVTTGVLVGHLRSAAIDVLRATGLTQADAVARLENVAGRADGE